MVGELEVEEKKLKTRIANAISLILRLPCLFLSAHVFTVLWRWFVLPHFPGAPTFSLGAAAGLLFVLGYLQGSPASDLKRDKNEYKVAIRRVSMMISYPLAGLVFGWVLHLLIP